MRTCFRVLCELGLKYPCLWHFYDLTPCAWGFTLGLLLRWNGMWECEAQSIPTVFDTDLFLVDNCIFRLQRSERACSMAPVCVCVCVCVLSTGIAERCYHLLVKHLECTGEYSPRSVFCILRSQMLDWSRRGGHRKNKAGGYGPVSSCCEPMRVLYFIRSRINVFSCVFREKRSEEENGVWGTQGRDGGVRAARVHGAVPAVSRAPPHVSCACAWP